MSRRFPAPARRSPVGVAHLVALLALVLVTASGTAFTAGLDGVPRATVESDTTAFPDFAASDLSFTADGDAAVAHFTVTSSDPAVRPGQVYARVVTDPAVKPAYEQCSTSDPAGSAWTCPVPLSLEDAEANAGGFESFASP